MLEIAVLSDKNTYPAHTQLLLNLQDYFLSSGEELRLFDMSEYASKLSTLSGELFQREFDIIISLDLAGFALRTQTGECSLNLLPGKILNLISGNKPTYSAFLTKKLSLSMQFYDISGENHNLPKLYPNMEYYNNGEHFRLSFSDKELFATNFDYIWKHFKAATLLP